MSGKLDFVIIGFKKGQVSFGFLPRVVDPRDAVLALQAMIEIIQSEEAFDRELKVRLCAPKDAGGIVPLTAAEVAQRELMLAVGNLVEQEVSELEG